ncbi:MAG: hypothetical protein AAGB00_08870 [Planctomycetota bacterium]
MTRTDQAFIAAYGRQTSGPEAAGAAPTPADEPRPLRRHSVGHGPHLGMARKTPLAEAIAERRRQPASAPAGSSAATRLTAFHWPAVVERLARVAGQQLLALAPGLANASLGGVSTGQALGVAGVHSGSGATTATLALARCLAAVDGPVAVVDADPAGSGAAAALGVLRTRALTESLTAGGDHAASVLHAVEDHVSLIVAGDLEGVEQSGLASAASALLRTHSATLIDFGSALDHRGAWSAGAAARLIAAFRPAGVALVRRGSDLSGAVSACQRVVEASSAPVLGLIDNRVAAEPVD